MDRLSSKDIDLAQRRIASDVVRTPLVASPSLSTLLGAEVFFKLETVQPTGSFKIRGAFNAVRALQTRGVRTVVTASTGNHGRALAYAARAAGMTAVVYLSELVPQNKVSAIRTLGASVTIVGRSQDDAEEEAHRATEKGGMRYVSPFDDLLVIAGQATIGREIVESLPNVAQVVVPVSGGGLFAGVAFAVKQVARDVSAIGVTMRNGAAMHQSLRVGKPILVPEVPSLADALGGGIGLDNRYTFSMTRGLIDAALLVDEPAIARGIRHAYQNERLIVEGAGAVGIAAALENLLPPGPSRASGPAGPVVIVLSGSNIDMAHHHQIQGDDQMVALGDSSK